MRQVAREAELRSLVLSLPLLPLHASSKSRFEMLQPKTVSLHFLLTFRLWVA
jgi:hypothetical protein